MNLAGLALFVAGYALLDMPVPYTITWRGTVSAGSRVAVEEYQSGRGGYGRHRMQEPSGGKDGW